VAITIPILTDFNGRGIDKGIAQFQKLETTGQKAGFLIRKAALPAAAAIGALAAGAVVATKAAAEDAAAADKLANTLGRVTKANQAALGAVEPYISALSQQVGVTDDELRPALGKLATATGDLTKSQELLGVALDVSAQTGKPLESVTTALAKAYSGQFGALNKLLPGFDQGIIKSKDFTAAQDELARLTGGAASESANTAAGQFRRFQITLQETKESIGAALLPVLNAFLPILQSVANWVQENSRVVVILGAAIATLSGIVLAVNAAMKLAAAATAVMTAAQVALNIAMSANPIAIVVLAIAGLVTAIVIAYDKSETFRDIVNAIGSALSGVARWINDNVVPAISLFWNTMKAAWNWIDDKAGPVLAALKLSLQAAFAPITLAISAMRTLIDLLGSWKKELPKGATGAGAIFGGGGGIPRGASGGIVRRPTLAMIGEDGPEAVIPLNRTRGNGPLPDGMGMSITVNAGLVSTPDQIGQQIIEAIQRAQRRSGPAFAPA
jgi:hypothetical protein